MATAEEILEQSLKVVTRDLDNSHVDDAVRREQIDYICRNQQNRAGVRFLMACLLAKLHQPNLDIRMPYKEIGGDDCYSGRQYDERYITSFVERHELPCNVTTAFLTPAFRNHEVMLSKNVTLMGRPRELYESVLSLLDDVARKRESPQDLLCEILRILVIKRNEQKTRMESLLADLKQSDPSQLTVNDIVGVVDRHLDQPYSSRLPVLAFHAIYRTIESQLNEHIVPLHPHTAADSQTRSLGDMEVALKDSNKIITVYEMKSRQLTRGDVRQALNKVAKGTQSVQQYLFVTTFPISEDVTEQIKDFNERRLGTEFAALDCVAFVRYFLHLFYQVRLEFLSNYQALVLSEPESGVRQPLKELFLTLRYAAESPQHS